MNAYNTPATRSRHRSAALRALEADHLIQQGEADAAIAPAQCAVADIPDEPMFHITLARALTITGRHHAARVHHDAALRLARASGDEQKLVDAIHARAWAADVTQDTGTALSAFADIIAIRPQDYAARYQRGVLHFCRHDYEASIADLSVALDLLPSADLHSILGHAHRDLAYRLLADQAQRQDAQIHAQKSIHHMDTAVDLNPIHDQALPALFSLMRDRHIFDLDEF